MIWKTYIGPLPERPVTASSWYSGSSTTMPIDSKIFRASAMRAAAACRPAQSTVAERRTTAATFGIARTTGTRPPRSPRSRGRKPGRDRDERRSGEIAGAISRSTASRICGLTARMTMSADSRGLEVRGQDPDAELLARAPRPSPTWGARRVSLPALAPARGEDAPDQGGSHVAGAEHGDALLFHGDERASLALGCDSTRPRTRGQGGRDGRINFSRVVLGGILAGILDQHLRVPALRRRACAASSRRGCAPSEEASRRAPRSRGLDALGLRARDRGGLALRRDPAALRRRGPARRSAPAMAVWFFTSLLAIIAMRAMGLFPSRPSRSCGRSSSAWPRRSPERGSTASRSRETAAR